LLPLTRQRPAPGLAQSAPLLINLLIPLCVTALVGWRLAEVRQRRFGPHPFAVVDEDKTILSDFLRGSANQGEGGKYLEPVFLEREEALRQINDNKISAVLVGRPTSHAITSPAKPQ
jgi:hypothetical protein